MLALVLTFCAVATAANNTTAADEGPAGTWMIGLAMVIIGAILLVVELSDPGFFIAIPGTILIVLGTIGMVVPEIFNFVYGIIIAMVVAGLTTVATIFLYRRLGRPEAPTTTVGSSLIGRTGRIRVPTDPDHPTRGKIQIGSVSYSASADTTLPAGTKAEVVSSEGVHVHVEAVEED